MKQQTFFFSKYLKITQAAIRCATYDKRHASRNVSQDTKTSEQFVRGNKQTFKNHANLTRQFWSKTGPAKCTAKSTRRNTRRKHVHKSCHKYTGAGWSGTRILCTENREQFEMYQREMMLVHPKSSNIQQGDNSTCEL